MTNRQKDALLQTVTAPTSGAGLPTYDHRPGTGPTLVLLHYWGGSARTWDPVVDLLPGRDVVALDQRGWGRSRDLPGPWSLERLAADVLDVVAEAALEDYVLVGHSMGGKVAQLVGSRRPVGLRGLVLVAPAPARPAPTVTPAYQATLARAYDSEESIAAVRDHVLTAARLPEPLGAQVLVDSAAVAAEARDEWPMHGIAEDVSARTASIAVPTLVVGGGQDQVEPVGVLESNLVPYVPGARLVVLPSSGHLIPLEAPAELAAAIEAFAPARPGR